MQTPPRQVSPADPGTSEQRWKAVRAHIAKGDKAKDKAEQHYIAAGQYLTALKREHTGTWAEWESLVKERAGIGKSRASELMAIADGTKTAAEVAAATTERSQRHRALSPLRNGENADDPETSAETMKAEFAAADGAAAVDDADGSSEESEEDGEVKFVADPDVILRNLRLQFDGQRAVAEASRKIIKVARLEDGARKELKIALERLIRKWKVVLNTLEYEVPTGGGHE